MESIVMKTQDGFDLSATAYHPSDPPRGGVLLAGAMATPQRFYRPFAEWLTGRGYAVVTLDYRGTFESAGSDGPRTEATFDTWGQQDVTAAARALSQMAPGLPLTYLGHSLGGQLFPSCQEQGLFSRYVAVASGNGYWRRLKTWQARVGLFLATQVWAPVLLPALGYFPGRRLQKVGDLPRGVMAQWHEWCGRPEYLAADEEQRGRFARVTTPFTNVLSTDDHVFTEECVGLFSELVGSAEKASVRVEPGPGERIGHHGYFRRSSRERVWPVLAAALSPSTSAPGAV